MIVNWQRPREKFSSLEVYKSSMDIKFRYLTLNLEIQMKALAIKIDEKDHIGL